MKPTYIVTSIDNQQILVTQEQRITLNSSSKTANIEVINPEKFNIEVGSRVTIGLSQKKEAVAGLITLFIPILSTIFGFFISCPLADLLKKECTETFKAVCVSICFMISCAFLLASSRTAPTVVKLQIKQVL